MEARMRRLSEELVDKYKPLLEPLLPLAIKAVGSRDQNTPTHKASREYTRLLVEFYYLGGSLPKLAKALGVSYASLKRRIAMSDTSIAEIKPKRKANKKGLPDAIERVKAARASGDSDTYHKQLAEEYKNGFSFKDLAKGLGIGSTASLYYGAQRWMQKDK